MDKVDEQYRSIPVKNIKGVGDRQADLLNNLGLFTVFDLLFNLPFRYIDKTRILKINELKDDGLPHLTELNVLSAGFKGMGGKIFVVGAKDDSGYIELKFFNCYPSMARNFTPGRRLQAFGATKYDNYSGCLAMMHPEVVFLDGRKEVRPEKTLLPVYHLTGKLPQKNMGKFEQEALGILAAQPLSELIPPALLPKPYSLTDALLTCHYPPARADGSLPKPEELPQFARIALEELTAYLTSLSRLKARQAKRTALPIAFDATLQQDFLNSLPYAPTGAQLRVVGEIAADLAQRQPMLRLVNGDVGSGKTLVAVMAALQAAKHGVQTVLMAPTEILALQHYEKCSAQLSPFGINCVFLGSKLSAAQRRDRCARIKDGSAQLIIGTHAVFQDKVDYHNMGLIIIDEQHRFGVQQRAELLSKAPAGITPHQLTLSATPIPRTLQLALYSDLAVSRLDEMPPGRTPIITAAVSRQAKDKAIERLRVNLDKGVQAYWVCPLIDESEEENLNSVKQTFEELSRRLPHVQIDFIHGQMKSDQKNSVMEDFASGKTQLLIATTIIEVGVDVPNATIMVIDNAERLGLAQLHQLRGRVGRGQKQSYCLLIYNEESATDIARQRLEIMKTSTDGFAIAAADLKLRGPGDVVGTRQAGFDVFRIADAARDLPLLEHARRIADELTAHYPDKAEALVARWFPQYLSEGGEA